VAAASASRLLTHVKVQQYLAEARQREAARTEITTAKVLAEFARLGFSNISDFIDWDVWSPRLRIREARDLDPDSLACIQELHQDKDGQIRIKLHSKIPALVRLGQHLGLFPKQGGNNIAMVNVNGQPVLPAGLVQDLIQQGINQGPEWMEGLITRKELELIFPERFRALGSGS
jgi:hypothetical protein